jgi:hypothetical protein
MKNKEELTFNSPVGIAILLLMSIALGYSVGLRLF